jgi:hypothetical protein
MIADGYVEKLVIKSFPVVPGEQNKPAWQFVPYTPE